MLQLHNNIELTKWKIFVNNDNNLDLEISEENSTDIQELNNNIHSETRFSGFRFSGFKGLTDKILEPNFSIIILS